MKEGKNSGMAITFVGNRKLHEWGMYFTNIKVGKIFLKAVGRGKRKHHKETKISKSDSKAFDEIKNRETCL